jgi:SagB-type dehydrogenase family enzyme
MPLFSIRALLARALVETSQDTRFTVGLRSDVAVSIGPRGILLRHPWGAVSVGVMPEVGAVLVALSVHTLPAMAIAKLIAGGRPFDDEAVVAGLEQLDTVLAQLPLVVRVGVSDGSGSIVDVEPISDRAAGLDGASFAADVSISLDRFAYLRRRPEAMCLCMESPLSLHRASLGPFLVPLLARIAARPLAFAEIADPRERASVELLVAAGLVHAGARDEMEEERLSTWSFHDLLFHARSRPGRTDEPYGAHFRHRERMEAPPAIPQPGVGLAIDLPPPDFESVITKDRSLTEVIESRQSVRAYGDKAITIDQLGELLYRAARARRLMTVRAVGTYEGADRPYPTGGLAADLEVYASVARCEGLAAGVYHYESAAHRLRRVNRPESAAPLLTSARMATGGVLEPQVLLTITSRFARTAWKYDSIAYALTLKHLGALLQTLYLVATSMGLGPCALGSGDADRAARVFGLDWLLESSVGELALGSRREPLRWVDEFADIVDRTRSAEAMPSR